MTKKSRMITGEQAFPILKPLLDKLGVPENATRVVIDAEVEHILKVSVTYFPEVSEEDSTR